MALDARAWIIDAAAGELGITAERALRRGPVTPDRRRFLSILEQERQRLQATSPEAHPSVAYWRAVAKARQIRREERWAATEQWKQQFNRAQREDRYTINVPGITDFIRIPPLESPQLRAQRYIRWQQSREVLPEPLRWIPKLINKLDDAQDLLYTAIALAIPLLKRLPRFFLGPLGIALLINDILNTAT